MKSLFIILLFLSASPVAAKEIIVNGKRYCTADSAVITRGAVKYHRCPPKASVRRASARTVRRTTSVRHTGVMRDTLRLQSDQVHTFNPGPEKLAYCPLPPRCEKKSWISRNGKWLLIPAAIIVGAVIIAKAEGDDDEHGPTNVTVVNTPPAPPRRDDDDDDDRRHKK